MNEFDEIELRIKGILEGIAKAAIDEGGLSDGEWTKRIKLELCNFGHEKGYSVSTSGVEGAETGEWLFDLTWSKGEGDPWIFIDMPLVLECEWSLYDEDILWDFQKLLVAKTKYRIFIFYKKTDNEIRSLLEQLKTTILNFEGTQTGERYFLAGFSRETNQFISLSVVVIKSIKTILL